MHPGKATMRCPSLAIVEWDDANLERHNREIEALLEPLSPRVAVAGPGRFWLEPFPADDEPGFAQGCRNALQVDGFHPDAIHIGIADGPVAASAAASHAPGSVPAGDDARFLAGLPLSAVPLDADLRSTLSALGIQDIGDLQALPLQGLVARFGRRGQRAWQLAWGIDPLSGPRRQRRARADASVSVPLLEPVRGKSPLLFVLRGALDQLCTMLGRRGRAIGRLGLRLTTEDGHDLETELPLSRASLDQRLIFEVLRLQLETWQEQEGSAMTEAAAVDGVVLSAVEQEPAAARQRGLFRGDHREVAALESLHARLVGRWGESAMEPPVAGRFESPGTPERPHTLPPAGLRVLPEPAVVVVFGDTVRWGRRNLRVTQWLEAERVVGAWWSEDAADVTLRWVVTESGDVLWLSEDHQTVQWYVHGWLD